MTNTNFLVFGDVACLDGLQKELILKGVDAKRVIASHVSAAAIVGAECLEIPSIELSAFISVAQAYIKNQKISVRRWQKNKAVKVSIQSPRLGSLFQQGTICLGPLTVKQGKRKS
jgi:hypothetical protein